MHNMDTRMHNMATRMHNMDTRMHNMDTRMHNMDTRMHNMDTRMHNISEPYVHVLQFVYKVWIVPDWLRFTDFVRNQLNFVVLKILF